MLTSASNDQAGPSVDIGLRSRRPRPGPEAALVSEFLRGAQFLRPGVHETAVFREPRLVSGYPDVVVVHWHPQRAAGWNPIRLQLRTAHFQLVQLLISTGPLGEARIALLFGRKPRPYLELLESSGLVVRFGSTWQVRSLARSYAVRGIVAFEAKVKDWPRALVQAIQNRWFASESYVLLPERPASDAVLSACRHHGVGVWRLGEESPLLPAVVEPHLPLSVGSWFFNEWVWRAHHVGDGLAWGEVTGVRRELGGSAVP